MGNIIGIHFGLTHCIAAFKFAQVEIVTNENGKSILPSVVSLQNGEILVGGRAYHQLKGDPENTIINIRNLLGWGYSEFIVQQQSAHLKYKIKPSNQGTEDSLVVVLGGKEYEPEDISAEILKQVVNNAQIYQEEQGQKQKITEAVITIPSYFNDKQRYATQNAGKRAGLTVKELLPEPTAAAISYGFKPGSDDYQTILVYDFGGDTFDSSVISAVGDWFSELGKAGDLWLSGNDINNKLIELVKQKVAQEEDLEDIDDLIAKMPTLKQKRLFRSLKLAAEQAKIDLSNQSRAAIFITEPLVDEFGSKIYIQVVISRSEFELMILPLVEQTIKICQQAIKDSNETEDSIDVVLMVGGSSQIPIVQQKVKEAFGDDKVFVHPRPMYAVAEGAAIVAAGSVEKSLTVSRNYGIRFTNAPCFILIKKGEELPVKKSIIIKTEADGQRLIHLKFFSPDEVRNQLDHTSVDEPIGQMWLALDQYYPKGTEITLTAEINTQNEAVQMTAHLRNDESIKVSCSFYRGRQDTAIAKEVETLIEQLNQEGGLTANGVKYVYEMAGGVIQASNSMIGGDGRILEDRKRLAYERLKELRAFTSDDHSLANLFISRFDFALKHCHSLVPNEQQTRMKNIIANLENAMEKDDLSQLQKYVEDAKRENENLPELVTLILLCRFGIDRAIQINPTEANVMTDKFSKMLDALEQNNIEKVSNLLQQVLPESEKYSDQNPDNNLKIFMGASISLTNFSTQEELIPFYPITYNTMSNNPYDILGVSPASSDDEIKQAFNIAMKQKKYHPKILTEARKKLLSNEDRLVADYLLPILPPILRFKRYDLSELEKPAPELQLIEVFEQDNLGNFRAKVMKDLKNSIINSL